jgi:hypothetical protein
MMEFYMDVDKDIKDDALKSRIAHYRGTAAAIPDRYFE